jgi:uncharacterized protein (DUF2141 family)
MLFSLLKKTSTFVVTTALLGTIASLSTLVLIGSAANAAELTVNVNDINQQQGYIMAGLYQNDESYQHGKPTWSAKIAVSKSQEKITFSDLPAGNYAIKLFHDANSNNKLDMNMLGMPKESYGFSNNVGRFGPPAYQKAKFTIKDNTIIDIDLF